ncbi:MAG TPA: GxxExxY protein [Phycisphaerales bacterium]|nr:GxxExxY protein [Phycisphaerales bacterium]
MEQYPHAGLTQAIIGAAIEVHRALGPGLLESAYEACLAHEFALRSIAFKRQVEIPVLYKGIKVETAFRADFIVEGAVIVELKSAERLTPVYDAQLLTYLKLTSLPVGLILNFNTKVLTDGIKRIALTT